MLQVGLPVGAGHQNVVEVHQHKGEAGQHSVDESLECHSGIFQTERHSGEFEQAKRCYNGCFSHISWVDRNLVIALLEIQLGENCCSCQAPCYVGHVGQGVAVCL